MSVLDQIVAERDALREELNRIRQELRELVAEAYGDELLEDLSNDRDVLNAIWNLIDIIAGRDDTIKAYNEMFPCSICGKPMGWEPNDNLGQALKAFVREHGWGHGSCVQQSGRKS